MRKHTGMSTAKGYQAGPQGIQGETEGQCVQPGRREGSEETVFLIRKCLIGRYTKGRAMCFSHGGGMRGNGHKSEYGKYCLVFFFFLND